MFLPHRGRNQYNLYSRTKVLNFATAAAAAAATTETAIIIIIIIIIIIAVIQYDLY